MARAAYTLLWWIVLPLLPLRLWWRGRREPSYRTHIGERFGRYATPPPDGEVLWVHAVSVGETRAAVPLIERLARARPEATILLTSMTAAGRETGRSLFGDRVLQAWLPYDVPFAVGAFMEHFRPRFGLIMETELWPNLVAGAAQCGVPVYLVNARLSERSAAGYARVEPITRPMLASLGGVAAQSRADADRLTGLGAGAVSVTGNLKFDLDVPQAMRERGAKLRAHLGARPVWLAASTREGEEALLLDALARHPLRDNALLLLVPRHPQRFDAVFALVTEKGFRCTRRSDRREADPDVEVVLGDSMGEMLAYCAAADTAFVGGSLLPLGGQNLIEPIALGVPTLVGPHTFNFAEATARAIEAGAARRVPDADALLAGIDELLRNPAARERMSAAASTFVADHRGASDRLWEWLTARIEGLAPRR